jgi:hypothetical protein
MHLTLSGSDQLIHAAARQILRVQLPRTCSSVTPEEPQSTHRRDSCGGATRRVLHDSVAPHDHREAMCRHAALTLLVVNPSGAWEAMRRRCRRPLYQPLDDGHPLRNREPANLANHPRGEPCRDPRFAVAQPRRECTHLGYRTVRRSLADVDAVVLVRRVDYFARLIYGVAALPKTADLPVL